MPAERFDFLLGETVNQLWFWGTIRLAFDQPSEPSWYVDVQDVRLIDPDGSASRIHATSDAHLRHLLAASELPPPPESQQLTGRHHPPRMTVSSGMSPDVASPLASGS